MAKRVGIALGIAAAAAIAATVAGCGTINSPAAGPGSAPKAAGAKVAGAKAASAKVAGARAATESFRDLDGRPVSLAQLKGHPVVLSFLSPGNADSQAQVPLLIRLAGAYQPEGVVFLAAGEQATVKELQDFARQTALPFPVWQDPGAAEFQKRGFTGLPAHQFLDRNGKVAVSRQGFMARGELLEAIAAIL